MTSRLTLPDQGQRTGAAHDPDSRPRHVAGSNPLIQRPVLRIPGSRSFLQEPLRDPQVTAPFHLSALHAASQLRGEP